MGPQEKKDRRKHICPVAGGASEEGLASRWKYNSLQKRQTEPGLQPAPIPVATAPPQTDQASHGLCVLHSVHLHVVWNSLTTTPGPRQAPPLATDPDGLSTVHCTVAKGTEEAACLA